MNRKVKKQASNILMLQAKPSALPVDTQFHLAVSYHQQGRFQDAAKLYESVLIADPEHSEAWHMYGLMASQLGKHEQALDWINNALNLQPLNPKYLANFGVILIELKKYEMALEIYNKCINLQPNQFVFYDNLGISLHYLKRYEEAIENFNKCLNLKSDYIPALLHLGLSLKEINKDDEAIKSFEKVINFHPELTSAHLYKANIFCKLKKFSAACDIYSDIIKKDPEYLDAYINYGAALIEMSQFKEAIKYYNIATKMNPSDSVLIYNLGVAHLKIQDYQTALNYLTKAKKINPNDFEIYNELGICLTNLKKWDEAFENFDLALKINPIYPDAFSNRGVLLCQLCKYQEAIINYDKAISINKDYADAYYNRGFALEQLNRYEEAIINYDKASSINKDYSKAYWNKSLVLLLRGDYINGFSLYEWRWRLGNGGSKKREFIKPLFTGNENIQGKTILIYSEQGLGDTLQFIRCISMISERGGNVVMEVQAELVSLFQNLEGISILLKTGDPLPVFDFHSPLLSLPLAFNITLDSIPKCLNLNVSKQKIYFWKNKLGVIEKPRVGLVWSGGFRPDQPEVWDVNERRNLPLDQLKILKSCDVEFISLQKGEPAETEFKQKAGSGWDGPVIKDFVYEFKDFSDTAALVMNLDLVIAVDTSTAHLAASLGKPVWLLNRYDTCWRWLLDREDSPWYPSIKIYRQPSFGDWDSVMQKVKNDLIEIVTKK
jgi:hypothetical protein